MKTSRTLFQELRVVHSSYKLKPVPQTSISHYVLNCLETRPESPAIIDGLTGQVTTRGQLADQILRVAGWMQGQIKPGSTVGVSLPNLTTNLLPILGCIHAGGNAALLNPIYTPSETEHALKLTKPSMVVTSQFSIDTLKQVADKDMRFVLMAADCPDDVIPFMDLLKSDHIGEAHEMSDFEATALMPFSSGTTGMPKAICLSHKNMVSYSIMEMDPMFGTLDFGKNMLGLLPMFHMYGFTMALDCLQKGAAYTVLPRFELESMLKAIQNYKITHLPIVPPIAAVLAKHPVVDNYDLSSIKEVLCAAAPLSVQLQNALSARVNVKFIRNGYGMSEMVAACMCPPPELSEEMMRAGSVGVLLAGNEARIVDPDSGEDMQSNQPGEILIRSQAVMTGYLGDGGSTAATVDKDGWIHTGDIGYYDDKNWFYITDRLKELIKYKGWQIAPAELEDIILTHPKVADCGVLAVPAPEEGDGDVPRAFVVLKPEFSSDEKNALTMDIDNLIETKLTSYKKLRGGVTYIDQLPRSLAGKLLRKELKKLC